MKTKLVQDPLDAIIEKHIFTALEPSPQIVEVILKDYISELNSLGVHIPARFKAAFEEDLKTEIRAKGASQLLTSGRN